MKVQFRWTPELARRFQFVLYTHDPGKRVTLAFRLNKLNPARIAIIKHQQFMAGAP